EREDAIVGRVIERELGPEARRRWARRLAEMALVFDATGRADLGALARAAAAALGDPDVDPRRHPFARALAQRALELAAEVASGRLRASDVSRKVHPWSEKRLAGRSRIAPRLRPPTDRAGLAVPATMITDVPGVRVGHATDPVGLTGVTVVLCDRAATCGVELRGGANDVVGLDYLGPRHLVATVNGVVLGGG